MVFHILGAMKTYWLEGRESRPSLNKMVSSQLQPGKELEWERAVDVRDSIAEHSAQQIHNKEHLLNYQHLPNAVNSANNFLFNSAGNLISSNPRNQTPTVTSPVEERRMYSPVTFQDVARRSIANSPNRVERGRSEYLEQFQNSAISSRKQSYNQTIKDSRSTSASVGGVWTDAESMDPQRTLDSLNSSFCYSSTSPCRAGTAPVTRDREQDSFLFEPRYPGSMSLVMAESCPSLRTDPALPTAPKNSTEEIETDTEYQDAHTEISQSGHVCTISENIESNNPKQGKVGRFKARIAPGHHKNCTQKHIKQDSIKEKNPPIQSGSVLPHGHHHTKNVNHHQCCGAFGNPHISDKFTTSQKEIPKSTIMEKIKSQIKMSFTR